MLPLMVDFAGKRVVVFGGGDVGARKAAFFCNQSEVTVFSRSFSPSFNELLITRRGENIAGMSDHELNQAIKDAFLVIAATSDTALNDRIGRYCAIEGILFNNADGKAGDVIIPSKIEGAHYLIAISTGGESPGISRFLREHIESRFPGLDGMIELQNRLRETLKIKEPGQERRGRVLHEVLHDEEIWSALSKGQGPACEIIESRYLGD
jgi:precorrin-2 dehydrogenase/sirohydrochlorin ferrochelatase